MIATLTMLSAAAIMQAPQAKASDFKPETDTPPTETVVGADGGELICKRTALVGSRFKKKMCATEQQWKALSKHSIEITRELQENRATIKGG